MKEKEMFKALFDNMTGGCAIYEVINDGKYGRDYIIKDFNKKSLEIENMTRDEVIGKSLYDLRPTIDDYGLIEIFRRVWKTGIPENFPSAQYVDENYSNWYENHVYKLPSGEIVAIYNDVTESENLKIKLKKSEKEYGEMLNNSGLGIGYYKTDGTIIWYNKIAAEYLGGNPSDFKGKRLDELFSKESAKEYLERINIVVKTGKQGKYEDEVSLSSGNYWYESTYNAIKNEQNELLGVIIISNDITNLKTIQKNLLNSENKFKSLFEEAPLGYQALDANGRFLAVNKAWLDIMEYEKDEVIGKWFGDFLKPSDIDGFLENFPKFMDEGETCSIFNMIKKSGENIIIKLDGKIINDADGNFVQTQCILQDITELKKLEDEKLKIEAQLRNQQKLESIGILAGGVAHEINNPINGIINYSQLIADSSDEDSENFEYAKEIIFEANRVAEIVKDLLRFSRLEAKGFSDSDISDIISHTVSLIKTIMTHDQIELKVDIDDGLPEIYCNSQQIQQVLMNLLTNARDALNEKYTEYNENRLIELKCERIKKNQTDFIRLTVLDNGKGIPASIQKNIFDPFFTTKGRDEGTGLGLSISYGIVKDHKGELFFETQEGEYTKFFLDLPVME